MNHFLITRFNVKFPFYKQTKDGSTTGTEDWLKERIELFKNYCLPSVVNQKNQNFNWLIFLDVDTPENYKIAIEKELSPYHNFHLIFIDQYGELLPEIKKFITGSIQNEKFVITTRLDNDDSIHKNFIGTIQKLAYDEEQVIDIRTGYQLDITKDVSEFRDYNHNFNPFISLVEPIEKLTTVYSKMHMDWKKLKSITIYTDKRLWIEIVHERNLVNQAKSFPLTRRINIKDFGLNNIPNQRGTLYILKSNLKKKITPKAIKLKKKILNIS